MVINAASVIDEEVSNDSSGGPDFAKCTKREVRMGFLTGTAMPGRLSTPVRSIIYFSELFIEVKLVLS